jgi:hypothetical protein
MIRQDTRKLTLGKILAGLFLSCVFSLLGGYAASATYYFLSEIIGLSTVEWNHGIPGFLVGMAVGSLLGITVANRRIHREDRTNAVIFVVAVFTSGFGVYASFEALRKYADSGLVAIAITIFVGVVCIIGYLFLPRRILLRRLCGSSALPYALSVLSCVLVTLFSLAYSLGTYLTMPVIAYITYRIVVFLIAVQDR